MNSGTVRVKDSELAYQWQGNGRPLVLIHGAWTGRRLWQPQVDILGADYQVLSYDLRGYGSSTLGALPYSHVDDLLALLDHLELSSATLVGHDLGGAVARALALEQPQRVDALVLAAAGSDGLFGIPFPPHEMELLAGPYGAVRAGDLQAALDLHEQVWVNGVDHEATREVRDALRRLVAAESFPGRRPEAPELLWSTHALSEMHRLNHPVLLIWGQHDQPLIERTALLSADLLPDVQTAAIVGAAHYANWEQPDVFNQALQAFLAQGA